MLIDGVTNLSTLPHHPSAEYLQRYKWVEYIEMPWLAPVALVTFKDQDIMLELIDGVPTLMLPDDNPDIYWRFNPVTKKVATYVETWIKFGFYRSLHLKEFLDQVIP